MAVITISRQFGAGGRTLGRLLAERLGYAFVDAEILQRMAKMARVSTQWVECIEHEAGGRLLRFISLIGPSRKGIEDALEKPGYMDEEVYVNLLYRIIGQIAEEDRAVIIGRGGQYILRDHPRAFHLLLFADPEARIRFMQTYYSLSRDHAAEVIAKMDRRRVNLYRKFALEDYDRPEHYHLTLNMTLLTMDTALRMVIRMLSRRDPNSGTPAPGEIR